MTNTIIESIVMNDRNHIKTLKELSLLKSDIIRRYSVVNTDFSSIDVSIPKVEKKYIGMSEEEKQKIRDKNRKNNVTIKLVNRVASEPKKAIKSDDISLCKTCNNSFFELSYEKYIQNKIVAYCKNKMKVVKDAEGEVTLQYLVNGVYDVYMSYVMERCINYGDATIEIKNSCLIHTFSYLKYMVNTLNFKKAKYTTTTSVNKSYSLHDNEHLLLKEVTTTTEDYEKPLNFSSKQITLIDVFKQREHRNNSRERFFYTSSDADGYSELDTVSREYNENYIDDNSIELLKNHFAELQSKTRNFDRIKSILLEGRKDNASKKALSDFMKVHNLNCVSRDELKYLVAKYC